MADGIGASKYVKYGKQTRVLSLVSNLLAQITTRMSATVSSSNGCLRPKAVARSHSFLLQSPVCVGQFNTFSVLPY